MPRMGKIEEDWNGLKLGFLKTVQPNTFSKLIPAAFNLKNNAQETYLFVSDLWFCRSIKFHDDWGRVIGKIKQNELDCMPWRHSPFKQQRRRQLRKPHLKSEFTLPQTLSRLFHLVSFVKCWQFFLLNSKDGIKAQEKKGMLLSCVPLIDKSWNDALSRRSRTTTAKKVQTCCFASLTSFLPFLF